MSIELFVGWKALSRKDRLRSHLCGAGCTVLMVMVVWLVVDPLLGVDLSMNYRGTTFRIVWGAILAFTFAAIFLGWGLLELLELITRRARSVWTVTAIVVLLSLLMPFRAGEMGAAGRWSLAAMHLAVGSVLILWFPRTAARSWH
jgi:hypothetical protein